MKKTSFFLFMLLVLYISPYSLYADSTIKELKQKDENIDHLSKPCQNKDYVGAMNDLLGKNKLPMHQG